uniref:Ring finger protein 151 n=1 Tax=Molossus molossus TaxID=27622 RepID=A0A7J8J3D7_MOLMO|nr:ring finger protein 151 [Molossus molossus]
MSGGYDLNLFTSPPDSNFLCSVCHGVNSCPFELMVCPNEGCMARMAQALPPELRGDPGPH